MNTDIYKAKLQAEKKIIEEELGGIGKKNAETGDWEAVPSSQSAPEADENDMADRTEDYEERSGTMATLDARLGDIDNALLKIENNTFGICESCGNPIEEDRLEANPGARTCKACMEKVA